MCWGKHYVAKMSGFKAMECIGAGQRRCSVGRFSFWNERETNVHGAPHSFHFEEFQAKRMHRETAVIMHKINSENSQGNGTKILSSTSARLNCDMWYQTARTRDAPVTRATMKMTERVAILRTKPHRNQQLLDSAAFQRHGKSTMSLGA